MTGRGSTGNSGSYRYDSSARGSARAQRKRQMKRRRTTFFSCLIILAVAAGIGLFSVFSGGEEGTPDGGGLLNPKPKDEAPVELTISCVGDIMVHKSQLTAQYDSASQTYNFDDNFQFVKKYIEKADLALCNVETTFAGGAYSGYPTFNAPDTLADALTRAGFNVAITANNHMMDKGFSGMQRTVEILRAAGLPVAGSRLEGETQKYVMQEVNGVKVAVVAYTYETPGVNGRRTINGNQLSDQSKTLINSFSYNSLEADLADVKHTIETARTDGADIVVAYFHWGEEYQRTPNDWQQRIALQAAEMGADVIFASHPHVLQGMEMLEVPVTVGDGEGNSGSAADGQEDAAGDGTDQSGTPAVRQVPVFYSMGNLISNQRAETLDNRYTEQGMIANVHLKYQKSTGVITEISMDAMPTWVDKYNAGGKVNYAIVPLDSEMESNGALKASGHLSRAKQALSDVTNLLGEQYIAK